MSKLQVYIFGDMQVATCGCLLLLVCWGLAYSMPVMFPSLAEYFMVPTWHFAACFSVGGAMYCIGGLAGGLADRYGTPVVVTAGLLVSAAAFLVASLADTEIVFAVAYIVAVGSGLGLTYAPVTAAVQLLSTERKIVAAGITSAGIGLGAMLLPPAVAWLYHATSWRTALQAMAGVAVIGILPVLALKGPVNKAPPPTGASALRTNPRFVWAFVGQMLFSMMCFVPFAHVVTMAARHGWSTNEGVELISLLGVGSTAGRFLVTRLAQRTGACRTAALCGYATSASMAGIALATAHWMVWLNLAIFGLTYGGILALSAPIVSEICGSANVGRNVGILMAGRSVGFLVGPWTVGITAWWLNSYTLPLLFCALIGVASAMCMWRSYWRWPQAEAA